MLEWDLVTGAKNDNAIKAVIVDRISVVDAPQGTLFPCIVINRISTPREDSLDGPAGLANPRIQFSCIAENEVGARNLGDKVRQWLNGFRGTLGSSVIGGAQLVDERDSRDADPPLYRTDLDFQIWVEESL